MNESDKPKLYTLYELECSGCGALTDQFSKECLYCSRQRDALMSVSLKPDSGVMIEPYAELPPIIIMR